MTITLQDPTGQRDPSSRHAFPDVVDEPPLIAPETLADELLAGFRGDGGASDTSFELESHGGYARTVDLGHELLPHKSTFFWPKRRTGLTLLPVH
jgi:hypothetical protein